MSIIKTITVLVLLTIGIMTALYQQAQAQTSPLTEDQDGNGDKVV